MGIVSVLLLYLLYLLRRFCPRGYIVFSKIVVSFFRLTNVASFVSRLPFALHFLMVNWLFFALRLSFVLRCVVVIRCNTDLFGWFDHPVADGCFFLLWLLIRIANMIILLLMNAFFLPQLLIHVDDLIILLLMIAFLWLLHIICLLLRDADLLNQVDHLIANDCFFYFDCGRHLVAGGSFLSWLLIRIAIYLSVPRSGISRNQWSFCHRS